MTISLPDTEWHYVQIALRLACNITKGMAADHPSEAADLLVDAAVFYHLEERVAAALEGTEDEDA